ncbi:DNA ligase D [Cryomorpha ignava]|uniref:DNA ligase (ATP) n=1 Tax=Cryomorpha ignava TaxID=101383 RepID=A0A7K3WRS5_9FLAO|nr:DNA ligase D [Cryomorpha ignava]NEN24228.1 DNA ligase D [Cryomorpha ignava]
MGLDDYNKKRKFDKTPEPEGDLDKSDGGRFVIQRHQASRLHYDLRLEMEGVLKSWAVPRGPSLNPDDKRLAVQTEDHPVKYLTFHGNIPKGNYGAGDMKIWDKGTYIINERKGVKDAAEQLKKGDLKIHFQGTKVKGDFALVKAHFEKGKNNWLLIKKDDEYAVDVPYDSETFAEKAHHQLEKGKGGNRIGISGSDANQLVKPMLAKTGKKIFDDKNWIYELKWDGYRTMASVKNGKVQLYSRNGLSLNEKFAPIARSFTSLDDEVMLDGEVVILNAEGYSDFEKLQNYKGEENDNLVFYVFDLVYLNGHSTISLPLKDRKELLKVLVENAGSENIRYCDHIETLGSAFYEKVIKAGFEGIMAKDGASAYYPGARSEVWLKFKNVNDREAIICGYTESEGVEFGSLILGAYQNNKLEYIGNCGTGFSSEMRANLLKKMKSLKAQKHPFKSAPNLKGRKPHWILPKLICEVNYSEITGKGLLRHPVFKRLRDDKSLDKIAVADKTPTGKTPTKVKESKSAKMSSDSVLEIDGKQVAITHPAKIYFPGEGIRKYDIIDYYIQIADTIMPYLIDRPQNLHRHPNGIDKEGFYQKDNENLPDWVDTIAIHSKSTDKNIDYLLCQDEATLIYMANLGCIEINPWNSNVGKLDNPTYTVIDIDPSEKTPFSQVVEVALVAKEILDQVKIEGYCKTSGSTGLHIYIPLSGKYDYDESRSFAKLICHFIQERLPKTTSMERSIKARNGKIYLDFMQNKKGQTLAAPYCVRPRPGATVSTPLHWDEVNKNLKISDFDIHNMPSRIEKEGDLFEKVLTEKLDMNKALEQFDSL